MSEEDSGGTSVQAGSTPDIQKWCGQQMEVSSRRPRGKGGVQCAVRLSPDELHFHFIVLVHFDFLSGII